MSSCTPLAAGIGAFGHTRNTSSPVAMSGAKVTVTVPSTCPRVMSTVAVAVYVGRRGSGTASGPGSPQPSIGTSGLTVVGGGGAVGALDDATEATDALDDGAAAGRGSAEQAPRASTPAAANASARIVRWCHGYRAAVPRLTPTCVWRATPALLVALDERFGEPVDAYVNGSQTWLRDDGPGGVALEWRLHPVAGYRKPDGLDVHEVFAAIALAVGTGAEPASAIESLWDGLEAFPAYDDEVEPVPLAAAALAALGIEPDACGLVDHTAVADEWERSGGTVSITHALLAQLDP
jgi:hypothetical protein